MHTAICGTDQAMEQARGTESVGMAWFSDAKNHHPTILADRQARQREARLYLVDEAGQALFNIQV
jgi:hypothetical protein